MRGVPPRKRLSVKNLLSRGIPRLFINATINQYDIDSKIKRTINNYLDELDQMYEDCINLVLYGSNGNGKSFCATLVVKEAYIQRYTSYITTFQSLLDLQFKKDKEEVRELLDDYYNADFLVIDEIGKEIKAKSEFNVIILEEILRLRDTKGLPTILCTNLEIEDLFEEYGQSVASLVRGNFVKLKFKDGDFRYDVTKEKLGIKLLFEED